MKGDFGLIAIFAIILAAVNLEAAPKQAAPTVCPSEDSLEETVLLAHESDCSKFYVCFLGEKILKECPYSNSRGDRLHFNPLLQVCDYPSEVGCKFQPVLTTYVDVPLTNQQTSQLTTPRNIPSSISSSNPSNSIRYEAHECRCNLYYENINGKKILNKCSNDRCWNQDLQTCYIDEKKESKQQGISTTKPTLPFKLTCTEGELRKHECQCQIYYQCINGDLERKSCKEDDHWDDVNKKCTRPGKAKCTYVKCPNGYYKPDEVDCDKYYTCVGQQYVPHTCASGLVWDREDERCSKTATCPINHCDQGYYKPHEKECDKYYVCYHNDYVQQTCPSGLHWDRNHKICTTPDKANCPYCIEGTTKPHELYCEWYYTCKNGGYTKQECSIGEQWDRTNHRCRRIEDANCPLNHCDQGYYKPHEKECDKYYVCYHNDYVQQTCPSGLHWDRNHKICTTPDKANCPYCTEGSTKPHELYCEWYYTCKNGGYIKQECSIGEQWDRTNHRCRRIEDANCPLNHCDQGYYKPHEKECDKYYVCYHNDYVQQTCPSGLHWDRNHKICTTPEEANCRICVDGSTKPHECQCEWSYKCISGAWNLEKCLKGFHWDRNNYRCSRPEEAHCPSYKCTEGPFKPYENVCNMYYECENNNYVPRTCKSGLHWNQARNQCTSVEEANCPYLPKVRCVEDSTLYHECKCELYYQCVKGELIQRKCPDGKEWDRKNNKCEIAEVAKCPYHPSTCKEGSFKSNELECNKYYVCENGIYVQKICPSGLYWDRKHNICSFPELVDCSVCVENSTAPHECNCNLYYLCRNGKFTKQKCDGKLEWDRVNRQCRDPSEANCHKNFVCVEGSYNYVTKACDPGLYWNQEYNLCMKPLDALYSTALITTCAEGLFKPHEKDCDKVYMCINHMYIQLKCSSGFYWNQERLYCTAPSEANCRHRSCVEASTQADNFYCEFYYVCVDGMLIQHKCPNGLHWDPIHNICTTPDKANCPSIQSSQARQEHPFGIKT